MGQTSPTPMSRGEFGAVAAPHRTGIWSSLFRRFCASVGRLLRLHPALCLRPSPSRWSGGHDTPLAHAHLLVGARREQLRLGVAQARADGEVLELADEVLAQRGVAGVQ